MSTTISKIGSLTAGRVKLRRRRGGYRRPDVVAAASLLAASLLIATFCLVAKPLVVNDLPLLLGDGGYAGQPTAHPGAP